LACHRQNRLSCFYFPKRGKPKDDPETTVLISGAAGGVGALDAERIAACLATGATISVQDTVGSAGICRPDSAAGKPCRGLLPATASCRLHLPRTH
jgi:hypothetical protein